MMMQCYLNCLLDKESINSYMEKRTSTPVKNFKQWEEKVVYPFLKLTRPTVFLLITKEQACEFLDKLCQQENIDGIEIVVEDSIQRPEYDKFRRILVIPNIYLRKIVIVFQLSMILTEKNPNMNGVFVRKYIELLEKNFGLKREAVKYLLKHHGVSA